MGVESEGQWNSGRHVGGHAPTTMQRLHAPGVCSYVGALPKWDTPYFSVKAKRATVTLTWACVFKAARLGKAENSDRLLGLTCHHLEAISGTHDRKHADWCVRSRFGEVVITSNRSSHYDGRHKIMDHEQNGNDK
jgi:hypothetical protein